MNISIPGKHCHKLAPIQRTTVVWLSTKSSNTKAHNSAVVNLSEVIATVHSAFIILLC